MRALCRWGRGGWLLGVASLVALATVADAADRTDLPLKRWDGFAVARDSVYDDLERLVTAGAADRTLLSTKPMSRIEAARIVARAIEAIRRDETGSYNARRDLEPVLARLTEEFREELAALGVAGFGPPPQGPVSFIPVDRAQVGAGYASRDLSFAASRGLRYQGGANGDLSFESRLQFGDVLAVYLEPEALGNEEYGALRLASGYARLTLWNVELLVGRENLWWGPGLRGSLILSNNAPPLDQVRIGAAEPFLLPWVGQWLGPTKLLFFVAQLEERRDHARAKLAGARATIAPFPFLELGISRTMTFGGEPSPQPDFVDFLRLLFDPPAGDDLVREPELRSNNVFAIDADLRLANVDRWGLPARDLRFYWEFGWDDTCCETAFVPLEEALSFLVGGHLLGVFGREGLEARVEYAQSSGLSFTHSSFTSGYWTRGEVISHPMGTDGRSLYARATQWITPRAMLGLQAYRETLGSTVKGFSGPKEKRTGGGVDLSLRFGDRYSLFAQYQLFDTENRNFRTGDDGLDHLFRLELTRSFR